MPRGVRAEVGTETTNANGYLQVKTEKGWVGKHTLILEEKLGRKLLPGEKARFADNDRTNLSPENIVLVEIQDRASIAAKIAKLQAEIQDRQALVKELEEELERRTSDT